MAIGDCYELVLGMNQNGAKLANRFLYEQQDADGPDVVAAALLTAFTTVVLPKYQDCCSSDLSFETIRIRRLFPTEGGSFLFRVDEPGNVAVDPVPPNSVAIIALYTDVFTKSGRGRFHVSGIPDDWADDGVLSAAAVTAIGLLGNVFEADLPAAGGNPAFRAGLKKDTLASFEEFSYSRVRAWLHTLRSRAMAQP